MSRPALPAKRAGVSLAVAARTYAGADDADGIYIGDEIFNEEGYNCLIVRTMPTDETEASSASLTLKMQAYDDLTATWYDMAGCSLAAISANRTTPIDLIIYPGITVVANRAISTAVPARMRPHVTIATATTDGYTFGVSYELHAV